jgi:hypothetical protein
VGGKVVGPISTEELRALAETAKLSPDTPVSRSDMGRWVPARSVRGLFANLGREVSLTATDDGNVTADAAPPRAIPVVQSALRHELRANEALSADSDKARVEPLIDCADCGARISKRAVACPHCGCPSAQSPNGNNQTAHARMAPDTTQPEATRSTCPRCGSSDVVKCSLAYESGTGSGSVYGVGLSEGGGVGVFGGTTKNQSLLARRVAPPADVAGQQSFGIGCGFAIAGFLAAVMLSQASSHTAILAFLALSAVGVIIAILYFNNTKAAYEAARAVWERKWLCTRCGIVFKRQDETMRRYAQHFEAKDRKSKMLKEKYVAGWFLASPAGKALGWHTLQPFNDDPPDLVCLNKSSQTIALEVTEFVDEHAIRRAERTRHDSADALVDRNWDDASIRSEIGEILIEKDNKTFHGGPYADICVLIFTDEHLLRADHISQCVQGIVFGPFQQISKAFVVLSYDPNVCGYPVVELRIAPQIVDRR